MLHGRAIACLTGTARVPHRGRDDLSGSRLAAARRHADHPVVTVNRVLRSPRGVRAGVLCPVGQERPSSQMLPDRGCGRTVRINLVKVL